ncbi:MAG: sialidase family protein [Lapillicoccus sp.]
MSFVPGRAAVVVALAAVLIGLVAAPAPAAGPARSVNLARSTTPDPIPDPTTGAVPEGASVITLGKAPTGYTLGRPDVLVTTSGTTLITWHGSGQVPDRLYLVRRTSTGPSFAVVPIPPGVLTNLTQPSLTEDRARHRLLLTAGGYTTGTGNVGLYVWVSTDDGRSWAAPRRVWDSFATGQVAVDGVGGFYAITDLTGVSVTHVAASLALQHWPAKDIILTDRLGSRGDIDLTTTGPARQLLVGWGSSDHRAWVHVSATPGSGRDVEVMTGLSGGGGVQLAGDAKGAVLVALREISGPTGRVVRLYASRLTTGSGTSGVFAPRAISPVGEGVTSMSAAPVLTAAGAETGTFVIAWLDWNDRLRTAHSTSASAADPRWSAPQTVVAFPHGTYRFPAAPTTSARWTALDGTDANLRQLVMGVRMP